MCYEIKVYNNFFVDFVCSYHLNQHILLLCTCISKFSFTLVTINFFYVLQFCLCYF